eukprot:1080558_1
MNQIKHTKKYKKAYISTYFDQNIAKKEWNRYLRNNMSIITDLFYGQMLTSLKCYSCNTISSSFDAFSNITLPLKRNSTSLQECLKQYFDGFDSMDVFCDCCKRKTTCLSSPIYFMDKC